MVAFAAAAISLLLWGAARAQESRWAKPDDPTAKSLINYERLWAEAGCAHNDIEKTILADDFQGTSPSGKRYSKQDATDEPADGPSEEACEMYEVTAHFFGDAKAILCGSESAVHVNAGGRKRKVKLVWTDTWLKRHGVWQVVAAQDMPIETDAQ
jgi:hypothetical protein